jgi:hypothetical protein
MAAPTILTPGIRAREQKERLQKYADGLAKELQAVNERIEAL